MPSSLQTAQLKHLYVSICTGTSLLIVFNPSPPIPGILLSSSYIALRQCVQFVTLFSSSVISFCFPCLPSVYADSVTQSSVNCLPVFPSAQPERSP